MPVPELQAVDFVPGRVAFQLPTSITAVRVAIPTAYRDRYWTFQADTEDVYIRFGTGTVDVDDTADSSLVAEALTEDTTTPHLHIPAGTEKSRRLPAYYTHFAHISAATGGKLRCAPTTGEGGRET